MNHSIDETSNEIKTRYPGARSFGDDNYSRKIFFGRNREITHLVDLIASNRVVVVYSKSGMGKSSLLAAGVAEELRLDGRLPLIVRLNSTDVTPSDNLIEACRKEAERQDTDIEEYETDDMAFWFTSVEFWKNDFLLKPVLIIDQFEELWTLHARENREEFIDNMSLLLRKCRFGDQNSASDLKVVFSVREEFIGLLEDASDRIPRLLSHRYRVPPLSPDSAKIAIEKPALLVDENIVSQPFEYNAQSLERIIEYLSKTKVVSDIETMPHIDPFQLQLICQKIEQYCDEKKHKRFDLDKYGGVKQISRNISDYYLEATKAAGQSATKKVRKLCERYLINSSGRRISMEECEIESKLKLSRNELKSIVDTKLLRTDQRAGSIYYELSHDTLIDPITSRHRGKKYVYSFLSKFGGGVLILFGLVIAFFGAFAVMIDLTDMVETLIALMVAGIVSGAVCYTGFRIYKSGREFSRRKIEK